MLQDRTPEDNKSCFEHFSSHISVNFSIFIFQYFEAFIIFLNFIYLLWQFDVSRVLCELMSILNCVIYMVFRLKASKGLAIIIFFFSSFHSFTFSTFEIVFLAGIVQLICWSNILVLFCIQFLGLYFRTCPAIIFNFEKTHGKKPK